MHTETQTGSRRRTLHMPWLLGFCFFAAIVLFFLWEEHEAHILGALPWALLLLCPIIHLFMHRRHGNHGQGAGHDDARAPHRHEGGRP